MTQPYCPLDTACELGPHDPHAHPHGRKTPTAPAEGSAVCPSGPGHAGNLGEGRPADTCPECIFLRLRSRVRTYSDVLAEWMSDESSPASPSVRLNVRDRIKRAEREAAWPTP